MTRTTERKLLAVFLAIAMLLMSVFVPGINSIGKVHAAVSFTDISRHWAASYIKKAAEYGFINGYSDKTFRPDASITRAEFTKMVNSVLGNTGTADITFSDVPKEEWFYTDVQKGVAAAFISGYNDETFGPKDSITRQQAAVMLSRVVPASGSDTDLSKFKDAADVPSWAATALSKMAGKGYISGSTDGKLYPQKALTRAQAAKLLVEIKEKENIVSKNQTVIQTGVTLKDTIYSNQISVGSKVGDGETVFSNCVILGNLNIEGGGLDPEAETEHDDSDVEDDVQQASTNTQSSTQNSGNSGNTQPSAQTAENASLQDEEAAESPTSGSNQNPGAAGGSGGENQVTGSENQTVGSDNQAAGSENQGSGSADNQTTGPTEDTTAGSGDQTTGSGDQTTDFDDQTTGSDDQSNSSADVTDGTSTDTQNDKEEQNNQFAAKEYDSPYLKLNPDHEGGVKIQNCRVAKCTVHRNDGSVIVRAKGETTIINTIAKDEEILLESNLRENGDFGKGFVNVMVERAASLTLAGSFDKVEVNESKIDMYVIAGSVISKISAKKAASKTNICIDEGAEVKSCDVSAQGLVIEGKGVLSTLNAYADNITYEMDIPTVTTGDLVSVDPERVTIVRETPKLSMLTVRHDGLDSTTTSYTILPISSEYFDYYIPASETELKLNMKLILDESDANYVPGTIYSVKYQGKEVAADVQDGTISCDLSVEAGSSEQVVEINTGSTQRGYGSKKYTITLKRIDGALESVYIDGTQATNYTFSSRASAEQNFYHSENASVAMTVNLAEKNNPDFVSYSVYRMTDTTVEPVAEEVSGGNLVTLTTGEVYRIVTYYRCYSDSYAGCKSIRSLTRYISIQ